MCEDVLAFMALMFFALKGSGGADGGCMMKC